MAFPVVVLDGPRSVHVEWREPAAPGPGQVRVRTLLSGISAGTELTQYRGTSPRLTMRWDPARRVFEDGGGVSPYPLDTWGYEEVGVVVEVGPDVTEPAAGDVVWGSWAHRGEAIVDAGVAAPRRLEPGQAPLAGAFARIGAIALNAVFDAEVLLGDRVAVFGQGVVGLLVTQLATRSGARVIAVDLAERRLELARRLGAEHTLGADEDDVALRIKDLTGGRGADVAIEVSGAYPALAEAIRATAYGSRVVAAGSYQGGADALFLGREFHHNRVELRCSQTQGVRADIQHRWDRLRIEQTVVAWAAAGRLQLEPLVSHRVPVERAAEAYAMLDAGGGEAVQVLLEFPP